MGNLKHQEGLVGLARLNAADRASLVNPVINDAADYFIQAAKAWERFTSSDASVAERAVERHLAIEAADKAQSASAAVRRQASYMLKAPELKEQDKGDLEELVAETAVQISVCFAISAQANYAEAMGTYMQRRNTAGGNKKGSRKHEACFLTAEEKSHLLAAAYQCKLAHAEYEQLEQPSRDVIEGMFPLADILSIWFRTHHLLGSDAYVRGKPGQNKGGLKPALSEGYIIAMCDAARNFGNAVAVVQIADKYGIEVPGVTAAVMPGLKADLMRATNNSIRAAKQLGQTDLLEMRFLLHA